jgi:hypothetical protein
MGRYIPLNRQFSPVPKSQEKAEKDEILSVWGHIKPKTWDDMVREFRCVILAEAGAGKTEELRQQANVLKTLGKPAFFIRIEDIERNFYEAFEIGEEEQFHAWLQSADEAWFFLDSVDEARLESPRAFEKALRLFAKSIVRGAHRAHIYLSSRPYSWRPMEDRRLMDDILFIPSLNEEDGGEESQQSEPQSALTIYTMRHLDEERIRSFSTARSAKNIDYLLREIERANLWSLAERPFDLESILDKWEDDKELGGRLELLRHNIDKRLRDDHNVDRAQRQPLNLDRAREGARRLAAAVILSGKAGINVPGMSLVKPGIEAEIVLSDWEPKDVHTLLERGIFNDIIYGAVRFRHRDIRELLAAEWFDKLLKSGNSRYTVDNLFFREQYGEKIIAPLLRPILPWLILFDDEIRNRALEIHPEIAVEGGDPSWLPLQERQKILTDIVHRIVSDEDDRSARDNSAISRIANLDLSEDAQQLINEFKNNDDAIFFLGRLVWQGEMASCVTPLITIAIDNSRGIYARIASARAVMTCGTIEQKQTLWQKLNEYNFQIPRELLAEVVNEAAPDNINVKRLCTSLDKLPPYERYKGTGLGRSLNEFVEKLQIVGEQQATTLFIEGLNDYLESPPYVDRGECHVSEEYAWLMSSATHAVERLIEVRSPISLGETALSIMLKVPALRFWRGDDFSEHKGNLKTLVPHWPELNDALYWASIEQKRINYAEKSSEQLNDDRHVYWLGHFWTFDTASLPRLLDYVCSRELEDDRLVALSTAFRVYVQADKPALILRNLQDTVADDSVLKHQLGILLNPTVSEVMQRHEEMRAKYRLKQEEKENRKTQSRNTWISEIRTNPERICNSSNINLGELSNDQYWLWQEIKGRGLSRSRSGGANWRALIPDFGEAVAHSYRNAAINHWRYYVPILRSEEVEVENSISSSLIFAMTGLEIEAAEINNFPYNLNESQVRHALRYITWELNGFPSWIERMHNAFPALVDEAVINELLWEFENTCSDKPMHYILHDLSYYAAWLHAFIAPAILGWIEANPLRLNSNRHYYLRILVNGGVEPSRLATLAREHILPTNDQDSNAWWYALRVDCDPINGIPDLKQWLSSMDKEQATHAAEVFVTTLMGGRHARDGGPYFNNFRTTEHLKSLYVIMHSYIRSQNDNDHTDYPDLRDDAQRASDRLFNLLSEIPGKVSYSAIKELAQEHPELDYRPWMIKQAYKRAEEDGDLEPWTAAQVNAFDRSQLIAPFTHRQLFDLAVHRLYDLKNWLERGNDSPWKTWKRASGENEMRTLIAGWLNQQCREQYTTAQEPELANSQRMDIWLHNTNVHSPVPIELKLLDKKWSGPKLCERLRNQLAGDYLREETAGCGVMLLVSQETNKRWEINNRPVGLSELAMELKNYWLDIANEYPGIEAIDVIVIDLTTRAHVSDL